MTQPTENLRKCHDFRRRALFEIKIWCIFNFKWCYWWIIICLWGLKSGSPRHYTQRAVYNLEKQNNGFGRVCLYRMGFGSMVSVGSRLRQSGVRYGSFLLVVHVQSQMDCRRMVSVQNNVELWSRSAEQNRALRQSERFATHYNIHCKATPPKN